MEKATIQPEVLRLFIADCLRDLRGPCCPRTRQRLVNEAGRWMALLYLSLNPKESSDAQ